MTTVSCCVTSPDLQGYSRSLISKHLEKVPTYVRVRMYVRTYVRTYVLYMVRKYVRTIYSTAAHKNENVFQLHKHQY